MLSHYRLWNKCYRLLCTLIRRLNDGFSRFFFFFFIHWFLCYRSFWFIAIPSYFQQFFTFLHWSLYCTLKGLITSSINSIAPIRTTQKSCFDTLLNIVQSPLDRTCFRSVFFLLISLPLWNNFQFIFCFFFIIGYPQPLHALSFHPLVNIFKITFSFFSHGVWNGTSFSMDNIKTAKSKTKCKRERERKIIGILHILCCIRLPIICWGVYSMPLKLTHITL